MTVVTKGEHMQQEAIYYSGPERRTRDRSLGLFLRRRQQKAVEQERRQNSRPEFDIAAALEMHLDQYKTRHAMMRLLDTWLKEARSGDEASQDAAYISAVERAIEVMKAEADVETAIAVLQRQ